MTQEAKESVRALLQVEKCPHHSHIFLGYQYQYQYANSLIPQTTGTWGGILGTLGGIGASLGAGQSAQTWTGQVTQQANAQYQANTLPQQTWATNQYQTYTLAPGSVITVQNPQQYQYQPISSPEPYSKDSHIWKHKDSKGTTVKYVEWCDHHAPADGLYEKTEL